MMMEMDDETGYVGDSKLGPNNLSRIWVANRLVRTEVDKSLRCTCQPMKINGTYYDTGDYQSEIVGKEFKNVHVDDYPDYWHHCNSMNWFNNCLRKDGLHQNHNLYGDDGKPIVSGSRPPHVILSASWWYQKLYAESNYKGYDKKWEWVDHISLVVEMERLGVDIDPKFTKQDLEYV
jgi:hypothetical protein